MEVGKFDSKGNVIGTTGIARDITERKQAEQAKQVKQAQQANQEQQAHQAQQAQQSQQSQSKSLIGINKGIWQKHEENFYKINTDENTCSISYSVKAPSPSPQGKSYFNKFK